LLSCHATQGAALGWQVLAFQAVLKHFHRVAGHHHLSATKFLFCTSRAMLLHLQSYASAPLELCFCTSRAMLLHLQSYAFAPPKECSCNSRAMLVRRMKTSMVKAEHINLISFLPATHHYKK